MNKLKARFALSTLALLLTTAVALADDNDENDAKYEMELTPMNSSGIEAEVEIMRKGRTLYVSIEASGLEPGKPHPQHIHGHGEKNINATCPGLEADADGDGLVSVREGLPDYGPIVLPLNPFDLVDEEGNLEYEATFTVNPSNLEPLHKRAIVMHGMTVNGTYIPSLPIACGEIEFDD